MSRQRFFVHLLCLFAYGWSATSLGTTLLMQRYNADATHVRVAPSGDGTQAWIFHHAGHRDQHEPQARDAAGSSGEPQHRDHVVKLAGPDVIGAIGAADIRPIKFTPSDNAPAALPAALPLSSIAPAANAFTLPYAGPPPSTRNSSLALVRLTRLRI